MRFHEKSISSAFFFQVHIATDPKRMHSVLLTCCGVALAGVLRVSLVCSYRALAGFLCFLVGTLVLFVGVFLQLKVASEIHPTQVSVGQCGRSFFRSWCISLPKRTFERIVE